MIEPVAALLPPMAKEMAQVVGLRAALAVVEHWGGTRLCVPHRLTDDHPLMQVLGAEAAEQLAAHYRGETLTVPRAAAALRAALYDQIVQEYDGGEKTAGQLAREHRVTERWIFYIVARARRERQQPDPQADLF